MVGFRRRGEGEGDKSRQEARGTSLQWYLAQGCTGGEVGGRKDEGYGGKVVEEVQVKVEVTRVEAETLVSHGRSADRWRPDQTQKGSGDWTRHARPGLDMGRDMGQGWPLLVDRAGVLCKTRQETWDSACTGYLLYRNSHPAWLAYQQHFEWPVCSDCSSSYYLMTREWLVEKRAGLARNLC